MLQRLNDSEIKIKKRNKTIVDNVSNIVRKFICDVKKIFGNGYKKGLRPVT